MVSICPVLILLVHCCCCVWSILSNCLWLRKIQFFLRSEKNIFIKFFFNIYYLKVFITNTQYWNCTKKAQYFFHCCTKLQSRNSLATYNDCILSTIISTILIFIILFHDFIEINTKTIINTRLLYYYGLRVW